MQVARGTAQVALESLNLADAVRTLCIVALNHASAVDDAARLLGISRYALYRLIKKHGIVRWDGRTPKFSARSLPRR